MDKITHQIRAEHWAKIMNECIAECLKLPGAGQMGSQKNSFSTGRGSCAGKLLRIPGIHHDRQLSDRIRSWRLWFRGQSLLLSIKSHYLLRIQLRFSIRIS